ncbi:MAG: hypothetical protein JWP92_1482, partial [Caulobacter sp.]|nr:hypothetical protein [Caulobacter sp.]
AAKRAALEQQRPGETEGIEFQDEKGQWRAEIADGDDRPVADVID